MTSRPRTLSEWLRRQDDGWLARLLLLRPDSAVPAAQDLSVLAGRLAVRVSISRALDDLDAWTLQVLDGLILSPAPASVSDLADLIGAEHAAAITEAVERLRQRALIWGEDEEINVVGAVRESATRYPGGLGRPAVELFANYFGDDLRTVQGSLGLPTASASISAAAIAATVGKAEFVESVLNDGPRGARDLLDSLDSGMPVGEVPDLIGVDPATPGSSPVRWLLAHGLLAAIGNGYVEVPREVGLLLRGDRQLGTAKVGAGAATGEQLDVEVVDGTAAVHLLEAIRLLDKLLEAIGTEPPRVLKSGGLGTREARKFGKNLGIEPEDLALLLHLAAEADLLAHTNDRAPLWLPTARYDVWREEPPERQWPVLAQAWIRMHSYAWLASQQGYNVLAPELDRPGAGASRRRVLDALASLPPGTSIDLPEVIRLVSWRNPRRFPRGAGDTIGHTLREAEYLGITGRGALSTPARRALDGAAEDQVISATRASLPEPTEDFLLQADLTAVAPGRLTPDVATKLGAVAELESSGGASVYRITEPTIRRALDSGYSAAELHEFFAVHSRTPVPQTLTYLIDDAGRRHGVLRLGSATAYLRCDDDSVLGAMLTDRRLEHLQIRRLAPGVAISQARPDHLLTELREAGYAPSLENATGALMMQRPDQPRASGRRHFRPEHSGALDQASADELVRKVRAGDEAAEIGRRVTTKVMTDVPGVTTASTLQLLHDAVNTGQRLSVDYVDAAGSPTSRLLTPTAVNGGFLHAFDHGRMATRTFAIHRIVSVAAL